MDDSLGLDSYYYTIETNANMTLFALVQKT